MVASMKFALALSGLFSSLVAYAAPAVDANADAFFTIPSLPPTPGPYEVSVKRVEIVDKSRKDPWAPTPMDRSIVLTIWYPIVNGSAVKKGKYLPSKAASYVEDNLKIPHGTTAALKTGLFTGGTPLHPLVTADGLLPIAVFSPGAGVASAEYATMTAPLASYGYYVIGMDHLYDSSPVEKLDGTVIAGDLGDRNHTLNAIVTSTRRDDAMYLASQLTVAQMTTWLPGFEKATAGPVAPKGVKLGIFGQSLGGSTAALCLEKDSSPYLGGVSFDGPFYGAINQDGLRGPFLYMEAENSETHQNAGTIWPKIRGWKKAILLKGASHYDYSDLSVLVPQAKGTVLETTYGPKMGKIPYLRRTEILATYLKAFFDMTLMGDKAKPFLEAASTTYPEISFESL